MALTGIQILKLLPNTNCGDCGFPTCLAFAMRLASKKASIDQCPTASEEAKAAIGEEFTPPIRLVEIGSGETRVQVGDETELFRHDKTFRHPPGFAIAVDIDLPDGEFQAKVKAIEAMRFERVGETMRPELICIKYSGDRELFSRRMEEVSTLSSLSFLLICPERAPLEPALKASAERRPLVFGATEENWEEMAALAKEFKVPLALRARGGPEALASLAEKLKGAGVEDLVLAPGLKGPAQALRDLTHIRRAAIENAFKPLGYPVLLYRDEGVEPMEGAFWAILGICKYGAVLVLDDFRPWELAPLFTLRQNIYTDPQKPLQMTPGIYSVGEPSESSPAVVTTNFSLTYYTVAAEIESAGRGAHVVLTDSEGMSVLTGWAAGKFTGEKVGAFLKESGLDGKVSHRKVIIPGYVAVISGELEDNLPGWRVLVGPKEASDLPSYFKQVWDKT